MTATPTDKWRLPPVDGERVNDDLLHRFIGSGEPVAVVYEQPDTIGVLGAGGKAERDLFVENCESDGVPIQRRRGGGGTVVLSPGMLILVVVAETPTEFDNLRYFSHIHRHVIGALAQSGAPGITEAGISDLAVNGRKTLGSSMYRHRRLLFYQSALLVENDTSLFERYLRPPWREPEYRSSRSHGDFCATLADCFGPLDIANLRLRIEASLSQAAQFSFDAPSQ